MTYCIRYNDTLEYVCALPNDHIDGSGITRYIYRTVFLNICFMNCMFLDMYFMNCVFINLCFMNCMFLNLNL